MAKNKIQYGLSIDGQNNYLFNYLNGRINENATRGKVGKIIEDVYVNEIKKTTTVKFSDGTIQTITCHPDDAFDPVVGVAIAVSSFVFGSKKNFHSIVQRKIKKSIKKSK